MIISTSYPIINGSRYKEDTHDNGSVVSQLWGDHIAKYKRLASNVVMLGDEIEVEILISNYDGESTSDDLPLKLTIDSVPYDVITENQKVVINFSSDKSGFILFEVSGQNVVGDSYNIIVEV